MTSGYYAYIIGKDGHIENRVNVVCDNDEEAKRCAKQLVDGHAIELWQEARRIATFQPKESDVRLSLRLPLIEELLADNNAKPSR